MYQSQELACNQRDHSNQHVIAICTRKECQKQSALCPKCIITFHQSCQENMIYLEELQTNMEKIESEQVLIEEIFESLFAQLNNAKKLYQERSKTIDQYQLYPSMTNLNSLGLIFRSKMIDFDKMMQGQEQIVKIIEQYLNPQQQNQNNNKEQMSSEQNAGNSNNSEIGKGTWKQNGNDLYKQQKYEEAILSYDQALNIDKDYIDALNNKGSALDYLNQFDNAIKCYDQVLKNNPTNEIALYNKGLALYGLNKFQEAIKFFDCALQINPKHLGALINKGNVLQNLNNIVGAIVCYEAAEKLTPPYDILIICQGLALCKLGRFKKGIQYYDQILKYEMHPLRGDVFFKKGILLIMKRNCFINNEQFWGKLRLTILLKSYLFIIQNLNKIKEAEECLQEALKLTPNLNNDQFSFNNIQPERLVMFDRR